ncbi:hypothetical protein MICRO11B_320011 [Micrococcus luteus]|nr:hypothetical protein MICRO11B_320011 [Micrococcus luteus]
MKPMLNLAVRHLADSLSSFDDHNSLGVALRDLTE